MQTLIETIIYLLAVLGIILVSTSFYEMLRYSNILKSTYSLFSRQNKKVEVTVKLFNVEEDEKKEIIDKIENGKYDNIKEVADSVNVEEIFDNK